MIWILLIVSLVVTGFILLRQLNKPKYYRGVTLNSFPKFIDGMMDQGGDGALLFFDHEGSNKFLQFAKYIESSSRRNLHFGFPLAPWSREYYETLKDSLASEGFHWVEKNASEGVVEKFLC